MPEVEEKSCGTCEYCHEKGDKTYCHRWPPSLNRGKNPWISEQEHGCGEWKKKIYNPSI